MEETRAFINKQIIGLTNEVKHVIIVPSTLKTLSLIHVMYGTVYNTCTSNLYIQISSDYFEAEVIPYLNVKARVSHIIHIGVMRHIK